MVEKREIPPNVPPEAAFYEEIGNYFPQYNTYQVCSLRVLALAALRWELRK